MITKSLDASALTLLNSRQGDPENNVAPSATVFASSKGLENLRTKIEAFAEKNRKNFDGTEGRPYNADLVQSIGAIVEAGLRSLWRSPAARFPDGNNRIPWEVWLDRTAADTFIGKAAEYGVIVGSDRLQFPEDVVVIANATPDELALAVRRLAGVRALAVPTVTADHFDAMEIEEQQEWLQNLQARTTFASGDDLNYVTLLDRGVGRGHPLISPALDVSDRHAADPRWGIEDTIGHGTRMAGLVLFGDLTNALQNMQPIVIGHRLESSKIIPDGGSNPHHLLGAVTRAGIDATEAAFDRRRTFAMASTTEDDMPHDGAPTSWSSEIDQLAVGASGNKKIQRLLLVSAGNTNQDLFGNSEYLSVSHHPDNEIESPAQAWNAISVGAYTEKSVLPPGEIGTPLARPGDLAPSSRTATWSSHWPIKPDVVLEGGNWIVNGLPPPMEHSALSVLTTDHRFPTRSFSTFADTSCATALAAKAITELWSDYPDLWPETIRAIFVSSARWSPQMRSHLPQRPNKRDFTPLFQRYGYGIPNMERARRSASNALSLIVQDTIIPYRRGKSASSEHVHNQMKLFALPWPVETLRELRTTQVKLRVALSTFVEPNPSEPARGSKFRYASHNLRFKLSRPNEDREQFIARISKVEDEPEGPAVEDDDGWVFGRNRRDVGSIQIDELTCAASDLARRNLVAVHPVAGWWKMKNVEEPESLSARFALVVEIDAEDVQTDLYTEVETAVQAMTVITSVT